MPADDHGQGVLAIPLPYNGWVQNLPPVWKDQLTPEVMEPDLGSITVCLALANARKPTPVS
jgi:hypothetical protein